MDERRDPTGAPEPGVPHQIEPPDGERAGDLSPVQKARQAYERHVAADCDRCRDIDRDRCPEGDRLYRAWIDIVDDACRQLAEHTP